MKPNLIEIIKSERARIKGLERAIPIYQTQVRATTDVSYQNELRIRLDELLLEYKERKGCDFVAQKEPNLTLEDYDAWNLENFTTDAKAKALL